jgi:glycosyltransferase involved in cell wall biosynthesis
MRSLHVVASDARRGAETFAVELVAELAGMGNAARVVALRPSGSAETHALPCLGPSRRSLETLRALRRAAAAADVVVAHGSSTLEACSAGLVGTGVPFVSRIIGEPAYWLRRGWRGSASAAMQRRAARHVVLWPGAVRQVSRLYGVDGDQVDVIANAVDANRYPACGVDERLSARRRLGVAPDQPCLAFVGALSAEKNVAAAVNAVAAVPDAALLIAGDGPDRSGLEAQARGTALGRVVFLGPLEHPGDVYAAADLLLVPSFSEGMPAVVIEAGLMGTSCVATRVGALPEMIDDGLTGYLAPSTDPKVFAATVQEAIPGSAATGAKAAETFRDRYTMERIAPLWRQSLHRAAAR